MAWRLRRRATPAASDQVRYVFVESEEPDDHWGYLEVVGKRVLDLGCGYYGADTTNTPAWFMEQGAACVIGVDLTLDGLNPEQDPNIALISMQIESADEVAKLYERFEPDVVKCDIEGGEAHVIYLPDGIFKLPEAYAIETHDDALYEATLNKLRSCGYKIKTIVDLIHAQGCKVIHATR